MRSLKFTEERNERVKDEISKLYDLDWKTIISKSRKGEVIEARRLYCVIMRQVFQIPLQTIGRLVNIHHASVIHAVKQHDIYSEIYDGYDDHYQKIKESLIDESSVTYFLDELNHLRKNKHKIENQINQLLLTKNFNKNE